MRAIFTIVDHSRGEKIAEIYKTERIPLRLVFHGHGAANSDILDSLGFCENRKSIMISILTSERANHIISVVDEKMKISEPGKGIIFSVPISSMTTFLAEIVNRDTEKNPIVKESESKMSKDYKHELIITIVSSGYFSEVKEAASKAGAKGGTMIHALGLGGEEAQKFLGITIQPEKEIVLMVVNRDEKNKVMKAITESVGINTQGRGIIFSLPVDTAFGLSETPINI